jgi:hypothetical protein
MIKTLLTILLITFASSALAKNNIEWGKIDKSGFRVDCYNSNFKTTGLSFERVNGLATRLKQGIDSKGLIKYPTPIKYPIPYTITHTSVHKDKSGKPNGYSVFFKRENSLYRLTLTERSVNYESADFYDEEKSSLTRTHNQSLVSCKITLI